MLFTTQAAILYELGQPLRIETINIPPLKRGQVLVEIAYSGVCRSQLMETTGGRGEDRYLPHLLGHEGTGVVLEIGEGVTRFQQGDPVIIGWIKNDGIDAGGSIYQCHGQTINAGAVTTFSKQSVISENRLAPLPAHIPMDVGVLFGCALPTGAGMALNELLPQENSTVAVVGLGGVGLSALMALQAFTCSKIIAIDPCPEKLKLAEELGATHTFLTHDPDLISKMIALTKGGVDGCIEAGGCVESIELGFELIKKFGGQLVFATHPQEDTFIKLRPYDLICGKNIKGSWGGSYIPKRDHPKLFSLYESGKLPLEKLFTRVYTLDQVNEALQDLSTGKVLRPLIKM